MLNKIFKFNHKELFLSSSLNFVFVSFIFLFGIKYENFQFRFIIFALLIPCVLKILNKKNLFDIKIFLLFFLILVIHSLLNIYFENSRLTNYHFFGIVALTSIFVISFYYYDVFNKNIKNIVNLFLIIFFISVCISFFNYGFDDDTLLFCGGIKIFKFLPNLGKYLPPDVDFTRIDDLKISLKIFLFVENSHLGMIAPSIIIYLLYLISKKETSFLSNFFTFVFIVICLINSSTTLLLGTSLSLLVIVFFNYKRIKVKTLTLFSLIFILFFGILIFDDECRKRFVPTYQVTEDAFGVAQTVKNPKYKVIGEIDENLALKISKFLKVKSGNLSSGVHYRAMMIAKKSIIKKPFGWGINRYNVASKYYSERKPSKVSDLNSYNNKDGTNNFIKILVEFGIFGILVYFFIILFLINKNISLDLKFFYLPFIITQSLRGGGYFHGGFVLILFLMLFTYIKVYKKVK